MKLIPLTRGIFAIVDDQDYEALSKHRWHASRDGYALRREYPSRRYIMMHRVIANPGEEYEVDHINHNPSDNRRENLRICTSSQNKMNRIADKKGRTSQYRGVYFNSLRINSKPWYANIGLNNKSIYIGCYKTEDEAYAAYQLKARELHGEFIPDITNPAMGGNA